MDLRDFAGRDAGFSSGAKTEGVNEEEIRETVNRYSGFSNEELITELGKQLARQRAEGKGAEIQSTIERLKPLLPPEHQKRMEEILSQVGIR